MLMEERRKPQNHHNCRSCMTIPDKNVVLSRSMKDIFQLRKSEILMQNF